MHRGKWPLGRVIEVYPGIDLTVRVVKVQLQNETITRPVLKLIQILDLKRTVKLISRYNLFMFSFSRVHSVDIYLWLVHHHSHAFQNFCPCDGFTLRLAAGYWVIKTSTLPTPSSAIRWALETSLMTKSFKDTNTALLAYRTTPLGHDSVQLVFNRKTPPNLPMRTRKIDHEIVEKYRGNQSQKSLKPTINTLQIYLN